MGKPKNPTTVTAQYVVGPADNVVIMMLGDILTGPAENLTRTEWSAADARALAKALNTAANVVEGKEDADE
jgi:hypothetical protein